MYINRTVFETSRNVVTLKSGSKVTRGHWNGHGSIRHLGLLINVTLATVSLSHTVFKINGDISRKLPIFPTPMYLTPPLKGFPLELGTDARGQKTRMMGLPGKKT